jgi:hypothetical protein
MDKKEALRQFKNQKDFAIVFPILGSIMLLVGFFADLGGLEILIGLFSPVVLGAGIGCIYGVLTRKMLIDVGTYESSTIENANWGICPQCFKKISLMASKCPYCTANLNTVGTTTKTKRKWVSIDELLDEKSKP